MTAWLTSLACLAAVAAAQSEEPPDIFIDQAAKPAPDYDDGAEEDAEPVENDAARVETPGDRVEEIRGRLDPEDVKSFRLEIVGSGILKYEGECVLSTVSGMTSRDISGAGPQAFNFQGRNANCRLNQTDPRGNIMVMVTGSSGNVQRFTTDGPGEINFSLN